MGGNRLPSQKPLGQYFTPSTKVKPRPAHRGLHPVRGSGHCCTLGLGFSYPTLESWAQSLTLGPGGAGKYGRGRLPGQDLLTLGLMRLKPGHSLPLHLAAPVPHCSQPTLRCAHPRPEPGGDCGVSSCRSGPQTTWLTDLGMETQVFITRAPFSLENA